jgi:hypothetical protein
MQKYGTTGALYARALVMVGCDENVIGLIVSPKVFMARGEGQYHFAIIIFLARRITPGI